MNHSFRIISAVVATAFVVACGGDSKTAPATSATPGAPAAAAGPVTPGPGGKIIDVLLATDEKGNYFEPAEITTSKGDVIRFTLRVGVHNVHFLPDSNAGVSGYPSAPSEFLQLPGQTWDLLVDMPAGKYYFQCDPHAALGMKGHLIVR